MSKDACEISCSPVYKDKPCMCYAITGAEQDAMGNVAEQFCAYEDDGFLIPCTSTCCNKCPGQCRHILPRNPEGKADSLRFAAKMLSDEQKREMAENDSNISIIVFLIIMIIALAILSTIAGFIA